MPFSGVWLEDKADRGVFKIELLDEVLEQNERGGGIVEGVVPSFCGHELSDFFSKFEVLAYLSKSMGWKFRPGGTGKLEGIHPGAESMGRESTQVAFFCAVAVGDGNVACHRALDLRPEGHEGRGISEVFDRDAVDFLRCPGDGAVSPDEGNEGVVVPFFH